MEMTDYYLDSRIPGQEVIIYRAGETKHQLKFWRIFACFLLFLSFLGVLSIFGPILLAETQYRLQKPLVSSNTKENKISFFGHLLWLDKQNLSTPVDWNFNLIIPKIGINVKVVPNVDPTDKNEYNQALKTGVAHAKGTSFPNRPGTTYIFGHSSTLLWDPNRQNAVFYFLKNLEKEDEIIVFFDSQRYVYKVIEKDINSASDIPDYVSQTNSRLLVLQTCWPPGTDWKRLFILAQPAEEQIAIK